jgi:phosphoribosyl-ATP pyrophosphohydrolase
MAEKDILDRVFEVIEERKAASPEESYVARLLAGGAEKINAKILEEAREVCEAGLEADRPHLVREVCDLLFHTFVLAAHRGVGLDDIREVFQQRFGTSGLVEKARRPKP